MKKVKFYLFALMLAACLLPMRAADIETGNLSFNIVSSDNHTCTLVSCATSATGEVVVPVSVEKDNVTYSVVSIAQKAFNKCTEVTSIYIPDGVTSIGNMAFFQCRKMGSIRLPEGIAAIGESTFAQCKSLTEIILPSSIKTIGEFAFTAAGVQTVVLNEGLVSLQESAFSSCESLENINIPSTLTTIGNSVFYGCESLVAIELPNTVNSVGEELFNDCSSLTLVTLPENITTLPYGFFAGCESLPTVALPSGITKIEGSVFGGCKALNSLTLPSGLKEIGDQTFYNCTALSEITIPESVTTLGSFLFSGCTALKSVVIPSGVTKLGDSVFKNCRALTEIVLPEGLTGLGASIFDSCTSLKKLDIPASMTQQFGISALANLTSLELLQINSPVFVGCKNSNVIRNMPSTCVLRVPADIIDDYRNDEIWGAAFANIEAIDEGNDDMFSSKHFLVHNMAEYYAAFAEIQELGESEDGVTIEFDASLKGQVFMAPMDDWKNPGLDGVKVPLKIIGNGVTLDGKDYNFFIKSEKHLFIEGLTLMHTNGLFTPMMDYETNIKNCRFIGCNTILPQAITVDPYSPIIRFENCMILGTEGKDGMQAAFGNIQYFSSSAKIDFISCTFAGSDCSKNSIPGFSIFSMGECNFVNCIFDNNKFGGGSPDVLSLFNPYLGEYNVINGSVSGITPSETNFVGECDPVVEVVDGIAYPLVTGKAYGFIPAGAVEYVDGFPTISGVRMPETDYFGTPIDYTKPVQCGAVQTVYQEGNEHQSTDYTNGVFIVNEDWYGHQNSTVNFLTNDGEWIYRVVQRENPGIELGCTNQFGAIYGDRFYLIAKQDKDPGATIQGGRITICDAKSMKVLKQIPVISDAPNTDGRGFLGVNVNKGYVGTSNGIYILDLENMEITGSITGTGNGTDDSYQGLYGGQIGTMVRVNDHVFAVHQKDGLLVINPETDEVEQTLSCPEEGWGFGSIVLSKDGTLWLSVADISGSGTAANKLVALDPATLGMMVIDLPDGIYGPSNSWYAWTPDCFCASTQHNVLYWNGGQSSWFSNKTIFKYDIDNDEFSTFIDLDNDPDGWSLYGCSFRIDPVTDDAYASLFKSFGVKDYVLRKYSDHGEILADYPMEPNYWFPSIPVWPDNAEPELDIRNGLLVDEYVINLRERLTDEDNMAAAAVFTITGNTDPGVVEAKIVNGVLYLKAIDNGLSGVTVQANSNGKLVSTYFVVKVEKSSGIDTINVEEVRETDIYRIDGTQSSRPTRGINIIRQSDGKISKVYVK